MGRAKINDFLNLFQMAKHIPHETTGTQICHSTIFLILPSTFGALLKCSNRETHNSAFPSLSYYDGNQG